MLVPQVSLISIESCTLHVKSKHTCTNIEQQGPPDLNRVILDDSLFGALSQVLLDVAYVHAQLLCCHR